MPGEVQPSGGEAVRLRAAQVQVVVLALLLRLVQDAGVHLRIDPLALKDVVEADVGAGHLQQLVPGTAQQVEAPVWGEGLLQRPQVGLPVELLHQLLQGEILRVLQIGDLSGLGVAGAGGRLLEPEGLWF